MSRRRRSRAFTESTFLSLEPRQLLSGSLDATFGGDGRRLIDVGDLRGAAPLATAVQTDGRIVILAQGGGQLTGAIQTVVRLNVDGSLDTGFGKDGLVHVPGHGDLLSPWGEILIQPDGKLVIVGTSPLDNTSFAVTRLNVDGGFDAGFGRDGSIVIPSTGQAFGAALAADGGIIVVGSSGRRITVDSPVAVRLNSNGTLDPDFGGGGRVSGDHFAAVQPLAAFTDVAIQADGKLVMSAARSHSLNVVGGAAVVRLNVDGSLDNNFAQGGIAEPGWPAPGGGIAFAIALQPDGKIVVAGQALTEAAVARFNVDGSLDATFDGDGRQVLEDGRTGPAWDVVVDARGGLLLVGHSTRGMLGSDDFAVVRVNANGSLDTAFGNGVPALAIDFGTLPGSDSQRRDDYASAAALDPTSGRLVVVGESTEVLATGSRIAVARLNVVADSGEPPREDRPVVPSPPRPTPPKRRPGGYPEGVHVFYGLKRPTIVFPNVLTTPPPAPSPVAVEPTTPTRRLRRIRPAPIPRRLPLVAARPLRGAGGI